MIGFPRAIRLDDYEENDYDPVLRVFFLPIVHRRLDYDDLVPSMSSALS
jgi:hypothetical protein